MGGDRPLIMSSSHSEAYLLKATLRLIGSERAIQKADSPSATGHDFEVRLS